MFEDVPGRRVGNETLGLVPAKDTIRPLRDHIVVEPLPVSQTIIVECWKPIRGKVLAVGPGHYEKKYNGRKGQRTKSWDSKHFTPTEVQVGDLVELGGQELGGYLFQTFRWGEKEVVLCREADVALIVET